jgi:Collagen triple helix repeat (20 copies)
MKRIWGLVFGVIAALLLGASPSHAVGLPLVISATVDYAHGTLTVTGQNFGSSPSVTLDALGFPAQSSSSTQVVAVFPNARAPSSFTPGTYFLTVTFKNQLPTIFGVDIGANGAQGPAGPAGSPGAVGAAGATGPAGPAGTQGVAGPIGPPGATGATGAAGAQGLQGVAGPQGPVGATGPQGPAGNNGAVASISCPSGQFISAVDTTGLATCAPAGAKDSDGDGIPDDSDPCPNSPNDIYRGLSYCRLTITDLSTKKATEDTVLYELHHVYVMQILPACSPVGGPTSTCANGPWIVQLSTNADLSCSDPNQYDCTPPLLGGQNGALVLPSAATAPNVGHELNVYGDVSYPTVGPQANTTQFNVTGFMAPFTPIIISR